jgi:hypothetical protein
MGERRDDYDTRSDERSLSVNGRRNWDRRYGGSHRVRIVTIEKINYYFDAFFTFYL